MAKKAVKKVQPSRSKSVDRLVNEKHIGIETTDWTTVSPENFDRAIYDNLRNYAVFHGSRPAYDWALKWVTKNRKKDLEKFKKLEYWEIGTTIGGMAKMHLDGCPLSSRHIDMINRRIDERLEMLEENEKPEPKNPQPVISKTDQIVSNMISVLENILDDRDEEYPIIDNLVNNDFSKAMTQRLVDYYTPIRDEVRLLVNKDPEVVECYSNLKSVKSRKDLLKFLENMIDSFNQHIHNIEALKPARKPRKKAKKIKPKDQIVKAFRYKKSDPGMNLVSINPEKVIGSSLVFVYNISNRKLSMIQSNKAEGITFKGAAMSNFDDAVTKTIRKPDDIIKELLESNKSNAIKTFSEINTKGYKYSGLGNNELIILKVFK